MLPETGEDFEKESINEYLCASIRSNKMSAVRESITKMGAKINHIDPSGNTPLSTAIKTGNRKIIIFLLKREADIFLAGQGGSSPVAAAINRGDPKIVNLLFSKGISVNRPDSLGNPPLIYASEFGKLAVASYLVNNGADVNKAGGNGRTPLAEAVVHGHLPLVQFLANKGAQIDRLGFDGNTALALAVKYKRSEIVEFLTIIAEADVCKAGEKGKPPLVWAVRNEDVDLIGFLLENGAGLGLKLALSEAAIGGNLEVEKLLMEKGACLQGEGR